MLGAKDGRAHARNDLHDHARDLQARGIGRRISQEAVHVDLFQPWDVPEGDGPAEQRERGASSWWAQGSVLVVGRAAVPGAQAGARGAGESAGGVVRVHEG